jgi:hypothetical protein
MTLNYSLNSTDYPYGGSSGNRASSKVGSNSNPNDESLDEDCDREDEVNELLEIEDNFELDNDEVDEDSNGKSLCISNENYNNINSSNVSNSGAYGNAIQHQSSLINFYSCY